MKRTILALYLLPFSFLSLPVTTDSGAKGTLKFALRINRRAYELVKNSVEVDMGLAVLKKPVRIGAEPNPTTFSIGLKNCSEVVRVYVTMDGASDAGNLNLFTLDVGGVTGVGLKIKISAGVQRFPKNMTPMPIEFTINGDGAYQLNYVASYVPLRANAAIGRVDTMVNLTVQYE